MDMFGPLYQVMFSSMTTRAAHLDLANAKTAAAFFMAFRRFASLRAPPPPPRVCWSDCGTNFVVAQSYLKKIKKIMQTGTFPRCRVFYVRNPPMISNGNGIYLTQVIRMASFKLLLSPSDKVSKLNPRIKPLRSNDGEHFSLRQPTSSTNALCIQVLTTSGKLNPSHRTIFLLVNIFRLLNQKLRKRSTPEVLWEVHKIELTNSGNAGWDTSRQIYYHETNVSE